MSALEISKEFETRPMTCWQFKWKVQQAMKSSKKHQLKGEVHIDEFYIGGHEEGSPGRKHGKKKLVVMAIEIINSKQMGRAYAQIIEAATSNELLSFMLDYVDKQANVKTDKWASYTSLKNTYTNLEQKESDGGKGFKELHLHIMNIQGWIRGIHHHCSKEHLQGYLDEYHYRFNRRNNKDTIFHQLIERMMHQHPTRLKSIQNQSAV
jgi:transposase-like protein